MFFYRKNALLCVSGCQIVGMMHERCAKICARDLGKGGGGSRFIFVFVLSQFHRLDYLLSLEQARVLLNMLFYSSLEFYLKTFFLIFVKHFSNL